MRDRTKLLRGDSIGYMRARAAAMLRGNINHHSELGRFLCTKTGEDQKSKVSTQKWNGFCVRTHFKSKVKSDIFCMPMPMRQGVTFAFVQISVSKVIKTLYFAYSVCQWGKGYSSSRPPSPGYATGIWYLEAPLTVPRLCYA